MEASVCVRSVCGYASGSCSSCPVETVNLEPDGERVERAAGLAEDLVRFHDKNRLAMVKYARARGLNREDAEDVVDETFLLLHRKHDQFAYARNPHGFAFKILADQIVDHVRRSGRRPQTVGLTETIANAWSGARDPVEALICKIDVDRAIRTLSPGQIDCLQLYHIVRLSTAEVAAYLDISPSAVTSRLYDAREQLKDRLPGYGSKEGHAR